MKRKHLLFLILGVYVLQQNILALNSESSKWTLKIVSEKANIRLTSGKESPVVATLLQGTILHSYEKTEEWFRIIIGPDESGFTIIGYLHSSEVEILEVKVDKEPDFWQEELEFFEGIGLSVQLSGGFTQFFGKEINDGASGLFGSWADYFTTSGYTLDTRTKTFHSAYDVAGEIIYEIKPNLGVGLGLGIISGSKTSLLIVSGQDIFVEQKFAGTPRVRAVPIRLGLFLTLPIDRLVSLSFNAGPSLYFTKFSYFLGPDWKERESLIQIARSRKLGIHGGVALNLEMNKRVALFIEGHGRYAKVSNFEGEEIRTRYVDNQELTSVEEGTLYLLEDENKLYFAVLKEEPTGFQRAKKVIFDLSGIGLRVGLRVKF